MSEARKLTPNAIANQMMAGEAWRDTLYVRAEHYDLLKAENERLRGLLTEAAAIDPDCGCIGCHEKRYELQDRIEAALRQEDTK